MKQIKNLLQEPESGGRTAGAAHVVTVASSGVSAKCGRKKNLAGVSRRLRGQPSIFSTLVRRNPAVPSLSSVPLRDEWYRSRPRKVFQKLPRMLRGLSTGGKKIQTSRLEFFKSLKKLNFYCILNLQLSCPTLRKVQKKSRRDEGRSRRFFVSLCCRSRFFCVA